MSSAIGYVGDEVEVFAFLSAQQTVNGFNHHFDDIDVFPLIESADIVGLGNSAFVENKVDGAGVVLNEEPVAHVLPLTIHGQWFAMTDIVDEEGYKFLGELVRPIVIGAVGHDGRHAVSVMIGTDEMVTARFAR